LNVFGFFQLLEQTVAGRLWNSGVKDNIGRRKRALRFANFFNNADQSIN
jgi:hypothetical protein